MTGKGHEGWTLLFNGMPHKKAPGQNPGAFLNMNVIADYALGRAAIA